MGRDSAIGSRFPTVLHERTETFADHFHSRHENRPDYDQITTDDVEASRFSGSAANGNSALRTLRRMLKAQEWKLLSDAPRFKLFKEEGRALRLDDEAERLLLPISEQPLKDIIILMRDTGMRNARELYRMRIENIHWTNRVIFNPNSRTKKGRHTLPITTPRRELIREDRIQSESRF